MAQPGAELRPPPPPPRPVAFAAVRSEVPTSSQSRSTSGSRSRNASAGRRVSFDNTADVKTFMVADPPEIDAPCEHIGEAPTQQQPPPGFPGPKELASAAGKDRMAQCDEVLAKLNVKRAAKLGQQQHQPQQPQQPQQEEQQLQERQTQPDETAEKPRPETPVHQGGSAYGGTQGGSAHGGSVAQNCAATEGSENWEKSVRRPYGILWISMNEWGMTDASMRVWCTWAYQHLRRQLPRPFRGSGIRIDLSHNKVGDDGLVALIGLLEELKVPVDRLYLQSNLIGSKGCKYLARYLQSHPVNEVHLSHNRIDLDGAIALLEAIALAQDIRGFPIYPLRASGPTGPQSKPRPIWLRLERNIIQTGGRDGVFELVKQAEVQLRDLRIERGFLGKGIPAPMLCEVGYGHGCASSGCIKTFMYPGLGPGYAAGPLAHVPWLFQQGVPDDLPVKHTLAQQQQYNAARSICSQGYHGGSSDWSTWRQTPHGSKSVPLALQSQASAAADDDDARSDTTPPPEEAPDASIPKVESSKVSVPVCLKAGNMACKLPIVGNEWVPEGYCPSTYLTPLVMDQDVEITYVGSDEGGDIDWCFGQLLTGDSGWIPVAVFGPPV